MFIKRHFTTGGSYYVDMHSEFRKKMQQHLRAVHEIMRKISI